MHPAISDGYCVPPGHTLLIPSQFQSVLDEALRDYIDRQQKERPRRHAMAAFASSLEEFDSLYRELAK